MHSVLPQLSHRTDKLESLGEALMMLQFARAETAKRAPHLTHPLLCLDAVQCGIENSGLAGLKKVRLPRCVSLATAGNS